MGQCWFGKDSGNALMKHTDVTVYHLEALATSRRILPSQRTMHLMAKAAVAVYESAVENHRAQAKAD